MMENQDTLSAWIKAFISNKRDGFLIYSDPADRVTDMWVTFRG